MWLRSGLEGLAARINRTAPTLNNSNGETRTAGMCLNLSVDWSERESVRAMLRLMVKRILRKYKYPPDLQEAAVELVLQQAQVMRESWAI